MIGRQISNALAKYQHVNSCRQFWNGRKSIRDGRGNWEPRWLRHYASAYIMKYRWSSIRNVATAAAAGSDVAESESRNIFNIEKIWEDGFNAAADYRWFAHISPEKKAAAAAALANDTKEHAFFEANELYIHVERRNIFSWYSTTIRARTVGIRAAGWSPLDSIYIRPCWWAVFMAKICKALVV